MTLEEQTAPLHLPYLFHRWERPIVFIVWISVVIVRFHVEVTEDHNNHHGFGRTASLFFQHKRNPQDATIYEHVVSKSEALELATTYCQMDFDITGCCRPRMGLNWVRSYEVKAGPFLHSPTYMFDGDTSNMTARPFEGKPPWMEDLTSEKLEYTSWNPLSLRYPITLEWTASDGSELKVVDCEGPPHDNCTTFYQSNNNITQYFIPVENKYDVDPDIFTTVTEIQYTSRTNDGNSSLVDVHCCLDYAKRDRAPINRIIDRDGATTKQSLCLESACPPRLYDPSKLLAEVWKATLSGIIQQAIHVCRGHLTSEIIYNASVVQRFCSDGLATQIAIDLRKFHRWREEADSDLFLMVGILTSIGHQFSDIPNHHWSLEEFLTIIMDTTSAFHQKILEGGGFVENDPPDLVEMHDNIYVRKSLGRAMVGSLTDKLDLMRSPGWQEKDFNYPLQVYNLTTMKNYEWIRESGLVCDSVSLLPDSKCGNALDALDLVLSTLLVSWEESELVSREESQYNSQQQAFVVIVGTLVPSLLLMQLAIRWQHLPGGCLMRRDLRRSIHRNRQVRMALEDEYLCRVRESQAIRQLGEDAAREALGLLRTAAYREPGLPHDYQMRQRRHSRWLLMGSQLAVVLLIAIRDWDVFLWVEVVMMLIHVMQSIAEVRAMRLLLEQDNDGKVR